MYDHNPDLHALLVRASVPAAGRELDHVEVVEHFHERERAARRATVLAKVARMRRERAARVQLAASPTAHGSA